MIIIYIMEADKIILIINFILQVVQMLDHSLLKRLKSSKCLCGEITLKEDEKNNDIEKNNKI